MSEVSSSVDVNTKYVADQRRCFGEVVHCEFERITLKLSGHEKGRQLFVRFQDLDVPMQKFYLALKNGDKVQARRLYHSNGDVYGALIGFDENSQAQ